MRWQFGKGGRVVRSQGGCTDGKILLRLKEWQKMWGNVVGFGIGNLRLI